MNVRFYNAKILQPDEEHMFRMTEGELWVQGNSVCYIGSNTVTCRHADTEHTDFGVRSVYNRTDTCGHADTESGLEKKQPIQWEREIDASGCVLMPGFKNAHTHTAMTFLRSYADDLPLQEWLNQQVFPKEAQLTQEDAYWLNILGIMEYLTSGITANFDMYFLPMASAMAARDTGFRTVQVSALNNFVSSPEQMEEEYYAITQMCDRTSYAAGIHAEYTTSLERMEGAAKVASRLHLPFYLHNSDTKREVDECIHRWGKTPTALTESLGMYEYGGGGYHCIWMNEADMDLFASRGLSVVTNPASNLKLASGIAPVKSFVDRNINVGIGTDGPASYNCLDMFLEIYLGACLAKILEMDAACLSAEEVLYMATAGGAKAMGLKECVSLAPGNKADLVMIDLHQPNMQPENNIVKNLVYSGSKQNVRMTMVNGRILYEDGSFYTGFEPEEVYAKANEIIARMV